MYDEKIKVRATENDQVLEVVILNKRADQIEVVVGAELGQHRHGRREGPPRGVVDRHPAQAWRSSSWWSPSTSSATPCATPWTRSCDSAASSRGLTVSPERSKKSSLALMVAPVGGYAPTRRAQRRFRGRQSTCCPGIGCPRRGPLPRRARGAVDAQDLDAGRGPASTYANTEQARKRKTPARRLLVSAGELCSAKS